MLLRFNSKFCSGACGITSNYVVSKTSFIVILLVTICSLSSVSPVIINMSLNSFSVVSLWFFFFCQFYSFLFFWYCYMNLLIKSSQCLSDSLRSWSLLALFIIWYEHLLYFFISLLYVSELLLNGRESYNNQKGA